LPAMQQPLGSGGPEAQVTPNPWNAYRPGLAAPVESAPKASALGPQSRQPRGFKGLGKGLGKINWNGEEIVPVRKNSVVETPGVSSRSDDECETMRLKYGITAERLDESGEVPKPIDVLEDVPFPDWAAERMRQIGYKTPQPIQIQGWPVALRGFDLIGFAPTGSGKTMAYVLPMLVHIKIQPELKPGDGPVGLVLLPCRELCNQVQATISYFHHYTQMECVVACGGEDVTRQRKDFLERADIVVATPGRLIDLLDRKTTNLRRATFVVLDEADQMLDATSGTKESSNFATQMKHIMGQVRPDRQVLLFSATYTEEVEEFARDICKERTEFQNSGLVEGLIQVTVGGKKLCACKDVDQQFWCQNRGDKFRADETKLQVLVKALKMILELCQSDNSKVLVFVNEKDTVDVVVAELRKHDVFEGICEGFCSDASRQLLLDRFRDLTSDLLIMVSTQVLGRGLDIKSIKFVVNYDMPYRISDYIHRIGRTGRADQRGYALTLLEEVDLRFAKHICDIMWETREVVKSTYGWDETKTRERGLHPPGWLEAEYTTAGRWIKEYHKKRATKGEDLPQGLSYWKGCGRGRRGIFLEELQGTGLARDPQLST